MMKLERIRFPYPLGAHWLIGMGVLIALLVASAATAAKTTICHKRDENNQKVLRVGEEDLARHFAHGDFVVGEPCSAGVGACEATGVTECTSGDFCSAVPGTPSDELCDGIDNDCNEVVDNDPTDLDLCTAGLGVCQAAGVEICSMGTKVCDATPGAPQEAFESTCSGGLDEDCDGLSDSSDPSCVACTGWTLDDLNMITSPASPDVCPTLVCTRTPNTTELRCDDPDEDHLLLWVLTNESTGRVSCLDDTGPLDECDANLIGQTTLVVQSCREILLRSDLWATFCGD
jgi:hypothetical protein